MITRRILPFLVLPFLGSAAPADDLSLRENDEGFSFVLTSGKADQPWLLKYSSGLSDWEGLIFFNPPAVAGETNATTGVLEAELAPGAGSRGFFKAIRLGPEEAEAWRPLVDNRRRWRRTAPARYRYQIRENAGWVSWQAVVTVHEGVIEEAVFSNVWPEAIQPTAVTIEGLFDRIETALESDAETVDVTWDPERGHPVACFIDLSLLIADEERSWTIDWLVELGGNGG